MKTMIFGYVGPISGLQKALDEYIEQLDQLNEEEGLLGAEVKCDWCGEEFEGPELQQTSIGMLCDTCIRAIKSRGESI